MTYLDNNHTYTDPAGYDARSQKLLEKYNKKAWEKVIHATAIKYISPTDIVCDFGCGTLAHLKSMKQAKKIYAIDVNKSMVDAGLQKLSKVQREKVEPIVSDASKTPLSDASCSIIWSIGLTEYIDLDSLFAEMSRVSQPNALMLLQFPRANHPMHILIRLLNSMRGKKTKRFRYLSEVRKVARSYGWNIQSVESTFIRNNLWCVLQKSTGKQ
jgi:ubiquinone/menaquinone biosynthesis C-methylase UbiE